VPTIRSVLIDGSRYFHILFWH